MRRWQMGVGAWVALGWTATVWASQPLAPRLVSYDQRAKPGAYPPAQAGVSFQFDIQDPAGAYSAYHADIERVAQAAADAWAQHLDGDAVIEVRVTINAGDGSYIMAAGPVLVQTGETFNGVDVWQAAPIWEIRGKGDPNGLAADADLIIAPAWLDELYWGYPNQPPANRVDAFDTLQHELGHILGFLHLEEYYTGDQAWASTYDIQTQPLSVGHEYAGAVTIDVYGDPVPLADTLFDADRSHVALATGDGSLMYPYASPGDRHTIAGIELGILADAGMPILDTCIGLDGEAGTDTDADGVFDCEDNCPLAANADQFDTDGDAVGDACDACPEDPDKSLDAGICGCGNPDVDSDGDGVFNCDDLCPLDDDKTAPGECGCGSADLDADDDGTADCLDRCPIDPAKTEPGQCGCGVSEADTDADGAPDCVDGCPTDPDKTTPGADGCNASDEPDPADPDDDSDPNDDTVTPDDPSNDDQFLILDDEQAGGVGCGAGLVGLMPLLLAGLTLMRRHRL